MFDLGNGRMNCAYQLRSAVTYTCVGVCARPDALKTVQIRWTFEHGELSLANSKRELQPDPCVSGSPYKPKVYKFLPSVSSMAQFDPIGCGESDGCNNPTGMLFSFVIFVIIPVQRACHLTTYRNP